MRSFSSVIGLALLCAACSGEPATDAADEAPEAAPEAPAPEDDLLDAMPEALHGSWDFDDMGCSAPASEMRLTIDADSITYYESRAVPVSIRQTAPATLVVVHQFSGEGEEWEETLGYEVSEDGERLTVSSEDGSLTIRMRCP